MVDVYRYYKSMEIRDNENFCIYAPLGDKLNRHEAARLVSEITNETRRIGIDLRYVYDCTIDFIEALKELACLKSIAVFNISADIFALFNIMKLDKSVNLYVSESDFISQTRRLINRKLERIK